MLPDRNLYFRLPRALDIGCRFSNSELGCIYGLFIPKGPIVIALPHTLAFANQQNERSPFHVAIRGCYVDHRQGIIGQVLSFKLELSNSTLPQ